MMLKNKNIVGCELSICFCKLYLNKLQNELPNKCNYLKIDEVINLRIWQSGKAPILIG